jgi:uncharacterized protein
MSSNSPNHLIKETSPYLLQHAYNPVDWYPWSEEALQKAQREDKLILVSIGYSACHWCHVMEHESFEDYEVAEVMNQFFVCIKVDREERPDIDQVYMSAVQLMTGRGGWPLNCFALPDGRPVYGGTYFPKKQWLNILLNLADMYKKDKPRFAAYADELTEGIRKSDLIPAPEGNAEFTGQLLSDAVDKWKLHLDHNDGGPSRAPKFPLPNNYIFLMRHAWLEKDQGLSDHVQLTLKKMAFGGIYDQIGGGFARYSVDGVWKVPHFEKMLYDNAQLVSLYSEAYRLYKNELYRDVVYRTLDFVKRELTGPEGNLFSALDADSEGEEGRFYVWKKEELQELLGADFDLFSDYFNINERGFWEHGNYILLRHDDDSVIAQRHGISVESLRIKIESLSEMALSHRNKRIRPGLDDKTLASWNALMVTGYLDAYDAFAEESFLNAAVSNMNFLLTRIIREDGGLFHNYKNGNSSLNGFLEDYAFVIQALIRLYQCTFDASWLNKAESYALYVLDHFSDNITGLFYFTSDIDTPLIVRKFEVQDNVVPASASQMAINLHLLGHYLGKEKFLIRSKKMLASMKEMISGYGSAWSNWLMLYQYQVYPLNELVICGEDALAYRHEAMTKYLHPCLLIAGSAFEANIPMTTGRFVKNKTLLYHCIDHSCRLPVEEVSDIFNDSSY